MAVTSPAIPRETEVVGPAARRAGFSLERILSPLLLAPSAVAIFIFVYGFIGYTFFVSLSNWRSAVPDLSIRQPVGAVYADLFTQTRFQIDLRNTVVFTILFLLMAVLSNTSRSEMLS